MKNYIFIGLMTGMICFVQACKNPCKNEGGYTNIASQLKKYSFKPGSYWVYQDSASGIIDSQVVYQYSAQNHVEVGYVYGGFEAQCGVYSDLFNVSAASFWNGVPHDSIFFSNHLDGDDGTDIQVVYGRAPVELDIYFFSAVSNSQTATFTNFNVSGLTFPIVYRDHSIFSSQIYHVDNVGVIKAVFNDSINGQRNWNLLRYHVINP